ncbi:hypothetical protein HYW43_00300 [Candidatus Daviesbacteria bacterium]|nr:hypothetical protein [Candidatus Daviesbacteria bacterium]
MAERLPVTPLEAQIILVNEIASNSWWFGPRDNYYLNHPGHYSPQAARALHPTGWKQFYHPEAHPLKPEDFLNNKPREEQFIAGVEHALAHLNEDERLAVRIRFGLDSHKIATFQEVGDEIGRSRERARQITAKAIRKLVHPKSSQFFRGFLHRSP